MRSYEITYNKVRNEYWIWAIESNGNAEIFAIKKSKRSCEIFLMKRGIADWTDRT